MSDLLLPPPLLASFLALALLAGYLCSLVWLLRHENARALIPLSFLTLLSAALHLYDIWNLPPGCNDDEFKTLRSAAANFRLGGLFGNGFEAPILWAVLFQAPVAALLDSSFWGMRLYPLVFGIAAVPGAFLVCRALQFNTIASLVGASLTGTLPWALFWGRLPWGGEILFYQTLLLAGTARIVWRNGGIIDLLIAVLGLVGLLYEYTASWAMIGIPPLAALLAYTWRQRLYCLGIMFLAILFWLPWLLKPTQWLIGVTQKVPEGVERGDYLHVVELVRQVLRAFTYPEGNTAWISTASGAMHPWLALVAAMLGVLAILPRRGLFLLGGFWGGLFPAIISCRSAPSTHRMIGSYVFIALAAAALFDALPRIFPRVRTRIWGLLAATFCVIVGYQSWALFMSPLFWRGADQVFLSAVTLASEQVRLPVQTPTFADEGMYYILAMRGTLNPGHQQLSYETWLPKSESRYTFSGRNVYLSKALTSMVPTTQVQTFGVDSQPKAYITTFTSADIAQLAPYGWLYTRVCSSQKPTSARIPFLLIGKPLAWSAPCQNVQSHELRGVWYGEASNLTLKVQAQSSSRVEVRTSSGLSNIVEVSRPTEIPVAVAPGDTVLITASEAYELSMVLLQKDSFPPFSAVKPPATPE